MKTVITRIKLFLKNITVLFGKVLKLEFLDYSETMVLKLQYQHMLLMVEKNFVIHGRCQI